MDAHELERDAERLEARALLEEFADAVEATGGVRVDGVSYLPIADEDWSDLGDMYVRVCGLLQREPKIEGICDPDEEDTELHEGHVQRD